MADKVIFVAFAMDDKSCRDLLRGQSLHTDSPFEYVDMSVKEPYDTGWKDRVRTRIKRSDGVIALISENSLTSSGQKWEIACAKEEKVPLRGFWCYKDDRTDVEGVNTKVGPRITSPPSSIRCSRATVTNEEGTRRRYNLLRAYRTASWLR